MQLDFTRLYMTWLYITLCDLTIRDFMRLDLTWLDFTRLYATWLYTTLCLIFTWKNCLHWDIFHYFYFFTKYIALLSLIVNKNEVFIYNMMNISLSFCSILYDILNLYMRLDFTWLYATWLDTTLTLHDFMRLDFTRLNFTRLYVTWL
jgi:hypothetical protein